MIRNKLFSRYSFSLIVFCVFTASCFAVQKTIYRDSHAPLENRVEDLLSRMSPGEKIAQLSGDTLFTTPDNRRLGIPGFKMADGPHGVRLGKATCFPTSLALAATWDTDLMYRVGEALGQEFRGKGRYVALGPCINIVRDPRGGRSFESMGEDPYLTSRLAVEYVKGIQSQKVIATPKHYACNNQEDGRMTNNVTVSERTLQEIYLPAFKACVQEANAWSIMSAYNKVDRQYCSENRFLLHDILKNQWGFRGYVVSDWGACHSTVNSINAGLDVEKPLARYYGSKLEMAVQNGKVSGGVLDDAVRRVLRAKFWAGVFEKSAMPIQTMVYTTAHQQVALEAARKAVVLLKNDKSFLPLRKEKIKTIAVIGPDADVAVPSGGGSSIVTPFNAISPLAGIRNAAGNDIRVTSAVGGEAMVTTGLSSPRTHDMVLKADVVIVVVGTDPTIESEGYDRTTLSLPAGQDKLIKAASELNPNTVVVITSGSAVLMNDWIDKTPAVLQCWFGGQEIGTAIADVLFGYQNPCGKLPITFPKTMEQMPPFNSRYEPPGQGPGYRYYDKRNIEPLFPFGHGLSYTTFDYNNIKAEKTTAINQHVTVSVDIKNSGSCRGDEVVQLYVHDVSASVERPVKELKAFKRVTLDPNQTTTATFILDETAFAFYDTDAKKFAVEAGTFEIMVGSSSRDIRQKIVIGKK
jgi:beta-glucosidase